MFVLIYEHSCSLLVLSLTVPHKTRLLLKGVQVDAALPIFISKMAQSCSHHLIRADQTEAKVPPQFTSIRVDLAGAPDSSSRKGTLAASIDLDSKRSLSAIFV